MEAVPQLTVCLPRCLKSGAEAGALLGHLKVRVGKPRLTLRSGLLASATNSSTTCPADRKLARPDLRGLFESQSNVLVCCGNVKCFNYEKN